MRHGIAFLVLNLVFSSLASAMTLTTCEGWQGEQAMFECSTGGSYLHGDARCRTINTGWILATLHAKMKTEHVFCRWSRGDDAAVCKEDRDPKTVACLAEFMRTLKTKTPKPETPQRDPVVATASAN